MRGGRGEAAAGTASANSCLTYAGKVSDTAGTRSTTRNGAPASQTLS
jgi:hypothetical protein